MGTIDNVKRKGVGLAIRVYSRLLKYEDKCFSDKFIIVGQQGIGTSYLKKIIRTEGLEKNVFFLGNITDLKKNEF